MPDLTIKGARRFDVGEISGVEISPQGYLRCDGRITRVGVFTYRDSRGDIRRELRLPDEVFRADALGSFALAPLTNDHPAEELNPRNTGKYQVGTIVDPRADGEFIAARIQITDAAAIEAVEAGRRDLSCGYVADLEERGGVTAGIDGIADGLRFDAIQRNIRGNHVALVDVGRAGPGAALRLDHADAEMISDPTRNPDPKPATKRAGAPDPGEPMSIKIKIDGVDHEVGETAAQAIAKSQQAAEAELTAARAATETERARADAAEEALAAEKIARADAEDPARIRKAIDSRLELERVAAPILGAEVKLDGLDELEIKRQVVIKAAKDPEAAKAKLDGCDPTYLGARYDAAIEAWDPDAQPNAGLANLKRAAKGAGRQDSAGDARARMIEANKTAGREPLAKTN